MRPNSVVEFTRLTEWKHPWGVFPEGRLVKGYNKRDLEINLSLFLGKYRFGNDLSSREATLRVLSAREVFTTVFGMGTGGVLSLCHRKAFVQSTFEVDFD